MSTSPVARRYAGALVSLASEQDCLEAVSRTLEGFGVIVAASPELQTALSNPGFARDELHGVVAALAERLDAPTIARNFLFLLVDNKRMAAYPDILSAFRDRYDELVGRVRAQVTSAAPLDAATLQALEAHVRTLTGRETVLVDSKVDPELLGGIITRVGDLVLDGSVRTQLTELRTRLMGQVVGEA